MCFELSFCNPTPGLDSPAPACPSSYAEAPMAGSVMLSFPVSTWPARCCLDKPASDATSTIRSYQPKESSSCHALLTVLPAITRSNVDLPL